MSELKAAKRYAKAMIDLSVEQNNIDVILSDMNSFLKIMKENYQVKTMLRSPVILGSQKLHILKRIFEKDFHKNTIKFFEIVIRKNRAYFLPEIAEAFTLQYNVLKNIMKASVKTAVDVDQKLIDEIKQYIENYSGKKVELNAIVDKRLIGGLVIQMEDRLFDASISNKILKLRQDLNNKYIS